MQSNDSLETVRDAADRLLPMLGDFVDSLLDYEGWGEHSSQRWESLQDAQYARGAVGRIIELLNALATIRKEVT